MIYYFKKGKNWNTRKRDLCSIREGTVNDWMCQKWFELVNRKCIIFRQDNTRSHVSLMTRQNYSLIGNFWFIHRIHQTLHFWKSIYFGIYKTLNRKKFISVVVQLLSGVWLFATPCTAAHQASLSFTISWSLLKLKIWPCKMNSAGW